MFDFDFSEDYLVIGGIVAVLLIAGAYYFYFRNRGEKKVEFTDVKTGMKQDDDDESVSSKDEYVCEGDMCTRR
jgi:hypothetical protein